jgi:hypothetical protein
MSLTPARLQAISEIVRDIGQIIFASVFVGPLLGGQLHLVVAFFGLILSGGFWYASLLFIHDDL